MVEKSDLFKKMIKEIIFDPQITSKRLSQILKISQPTVARYRKELEEKGTLKYFAYVDNGESGTKTFSARKLYLFSFGPGITRKQVSDLLESDHQRRFFYNKHFMSAHVGDSDGKVVLVCVLESRVRGDFVDIVNGEIIPFLVNHLGKGCVSDVQGVDIEDTLRVLHNYEGKDMVVKNKDAIYVADKL